MKIGLIDVDGHNFPNLALMKLSAWHKAQGDDAEMVFPMAKYDRVYMSKVFTATPDFDTCVNAKEIIRGGTGYDLKNKLPPEIEAMRPDYSLYNNTETAYGFLTRGCPRGCPFCIVGEKEGRRSYKVADVTDWWSGQKKIELLDPNLLACKDHMELLKELATTKASVDISQGADCRLLTEDNINALNHVNISMIHFAWDMMKNTTAVLQGLELYAKLGGVHDERRRRVYVLTNFDTTMEENLYRIYKLRELKYDPYVMIYEKWKAPPEILHLQRWVNNKFIWRTCEKFEDYQVG